MYNWSHEASFRYFINVDVSKVSTPKKFNLSDQEKKNLFSFIRTEYLNQVLKNELQENLSRLPMFIEN